jgi:hypothetical protein
MKTSILRTIATVTAVSLLSASVAFAGGKGGNGGNHGNGFKINFGGNGGGGNGGGGNTIAKKNSTSSNIGRAIAIGAALNATRNLNNGNNGGGQCHNNNGNGNGNCNGNNNNGNCNDGGYDNYDQLGGLNDPNAGQAYEPFHSNYVVLPGDSFYTISLKEYATSANAKYIARFNNLPQSAALRPGQIVKLPAISVTGRLTTSRSPVADQLSNNTTENAVSNFTNGTTNGTTSSTTSTSTTTTAEAPRPKVTVGSTLLVDGQSFGDKQGAARLRVGGAALKVEVVEWNGSSVKIRLPQLDLDSSTNADIEVVRADGTLASKTGVELGSGTEVALTK